MTFRSLAFSALKGNWRAYSAFFLSSVFAVFIFYVYSAFLYHPDIVEGQFNSAVMVQRSMIICQVFVAVFSFFFVLYANAAFLKTRQKEFGLLTLFGMTRNQLRRMIWIENTALAVLAIIFGIGIGILFSKLFFMLIAVLLHAEHPLPFIVPLRAVLLTAAGYMALFQLLTAWSCLRLKKQQIIDLIRAARKTKALPRVSLSLGLLAVLSLAGCYYMAWHLDPYNFILLVLPILALVSLGTYFLFTQTSILLLRFLQMRKNLYYRKTNLIVVTQLVYKLRENAVIFFIISLLGATVLTASSTFYVLAATSKDQLLNNNPQTLSYYELGSDHHEIADPGFIEQIFAEEGHRLSYTLETTGIPVEKLAASAPDKKKQLEADSLFAHMAQRSVVISESDYNRAAAIVYRLAPVELQTGQTLLVYPYWNFNQPALEMIGGIHFKLKGRQMSLQLKEVQYKAVVQPLGPFTYLLVLSDQQFKELEQLVPPAERYRLYSFEPKDWTGAKSAVEQIRSVVPEPLAGQVYAERASVFREMQELTGLTLFVGLFISLLCFIASGSMLYFKLFTEMKEDEMQFRALARIGLTASETGKIVGAQLAILFFAPLLLACVHTSFAMKSLSNLLNIHAWQYSLVIMAVYLLLQAVYFLFTFAVYRRAMIAASRP